MSGEESERLCLIARIEAIVADAAVSGEMIRAGYHAGMMAADFPQFSLGRIIDEIVAAAAVAKVPVEISRRDDW
jgi:hypothetical protein